MAIHRSPMGPIDGPLMAIDGNRNFRSQKIVRLGHVQSFDKTRQIFQSV